MQPHEIRAGEHYVGHEGYTVRKVEEIVLRPPRVTFRRVRNAAGKPVGGPLKTVRLETFAAWAVAVVDKGEGKP